MRAISTANGRCCCRGTCLCGADGTSSFGDTILVHFTGFAFPSNCFQTPAEIGTAGIGDASITFQTAQIISFPLNGTFCLTNVPGTCRYTCSLACEVAVGDEAISFGSGSGGPCMGPDPHIWTTATISVSLNYEAGVGAIASIGVTLDTPAPPGDIQVQCTLFSNTNYPFVPPSPQILDCGGSVTLSNTIFLCQSVADDPGIYTDPHVGGNLVFRQCPYPGVFAYNGTAILMDTGC